jgi:hypothetical protein
MSRVASTVVVAATPLSTDDAARVAQFRFPDDWSVYDLSSARLVLDELDHYWAVATILDLETWIPSPAQELARQREDG